MTIRLLLEVTLPNEGRECHLPATSKMAESIGNMEERERS